MNSIISNAHSGWQYVALISVIVAIVVAWRAGTVWTDSNTKVYSYAAIAVDIQVTLGILSWIMLSGWNGGLAQGWIHPVAGFGALGAIHAFLGRARAAADATSHTLVRNGFLLGLALIVVAIGLGEIV